MWWGKNKIRCPKQGVIKNELENFMEHVVQKEKRKNASSVVGLV